MYHARADMNNRFIQALNYNVAKYDAMCGNDGGPYRRASHINHKAQGHSSIMNRGSTKWITLKIGCQGGAENW